MDVPFPGMVDYPGPNLYKPLYNRVYGGRDGHAGSLGRADPHNAIALDFLRKRNDSLCALLNWRQSMDGVIRNLTLNLVQEFGAGHYVFLSRAFPPIKYLTTQNRYILLVPHPRTDLWHAPCISRWKPCTHLLSWGEPCYFY